MTPDQIKALAKQAGAHPRQPHIGVTMFEDSELAEFIRLVREDAYSKAARVCQLAALRCGSLAACEGEIRSLE